MPVSKKRSTRRNRKNRGQKFYRMRGCSTKKHLGGSLANVYTNQGTHGEIQPTLNSQTGGNCGCGGNLPLQSGGAYYGGVTGNAWEGGKLTSWPGGNNVSSGGNHFPLNKYKHDMSRHSGKYNLHGGRRRGSRKGMGKNMRGGINLSNTIGQDFVNLARQGMNGIGNMFNAYRGFAPSPSPMPWKNQLPSTLTSNALKIMKI